MKILHTADWHLGKRLYNHDLLGDCRLFLSWLREQIIERQIDVLLIAGDVFDSSNPPQEAMQTYYAFLTELIPTKCQLIITGGNHDSPAVLNAPRHILKQLNIHVIGGACDDCTEEVIPLLNKDGCVEAVVCAVPFLRDRDLKRAIEGETMTDRREAVRMGITRRYQQVFNHGSACFDQVPVIGMGHLFVNGAAPSDGDERLHTIGTLDVFEAALFPAFDYLALGHIHRPQRIGGTNHIRYSGSPLPLSFSERLDDKHVVEIEISQGKITRIDELAVPKFRTLRRLSGPFMEVEAWLNGHTHEQPLATLVEVELVEGVRDIRMVDIAKLYFDKFESTHAVVLSWRFRFEQQVHEVEELFGEGTRLLDLSEREVFDRLLDDRGFEGDDRNLVTEAFDELLAEVQQTN